MLTTGKQRGITEAKLSDFYDREMIGKDDDGYFLYTIKENKTGYF